MTVFWTPLPRSTSFHPLPSRIYFTFCMTPSVLSPLCILIFTRFCNPSYYLLSFFPTYLFFPFPWYSTWSRAVVHEEVLHQIINLELMSFLPFLQFLCIFHYNSLSNVYHSGHPAFESFSRLLTGQYWIIALKYAAVPYFMLLSNTLFLILMCVSPCIFFCNSIEIIPTNTQIWSIWHKLAYMFRSSMAIIRALHTKNTENYSL
jgi:hypothetical protein